MIEKYATIAKPLINLTKKNAKFIWDQCCKSSFETLKQKLTSKPIIAFANHNNLPFNLYTDSSGYSISAILYQLKEGRESLIAYGGRNLSPAEQNRACANASTSPNFTHLNSTTVICDLISPRFIPTVNP